MDISVIIATYNRSTLLIRLLESLDKQEYPKDRYEIVVVVDGSTDETVQVLKAFQPRFAFHWIEQANRGQASARNAGISMARGELILFLDDDLLVPPDLLWAHTHAHEARPAAVVFGAVFTSDESRPGLATEFNKWIMDGYYNELEAGRIPVWPIHAHVLPNSSMPRWVLTRHGGFDEGFYRAHEDSELGLRLWKRGIQFHYLKNKAVYQIYSKSLREAVFDDSRFDGRSEVLICERHPEYYPHSQLAPPSRRRNRLFVKATVLAVRTCPSLCRAFLMLVAAFYRDPRGRRIGFKSFEIVSRALLLSAAIDQAGGSEAFYRKYWDRRA